VIIILVEKLSNGDESHSFGGVACDVEGCDALEEQRLDSRKNLLAEGWFIAPGRHRCPKHHDVDVPAQGTVHREVAKVGKRI
jgi:hypothetical protein